MNVLKSSPGLKSSETWLPLCLPKFNPNGFVYALIDYVKENIGLVFVSADREGFEQLQGWKRSVVRVSVGRSVMGSMGCVIQDLMGTSHLVIGVEIGRRAYTGSLGVGCSGGSIPLQ
jgi:hypothetical protein